MTIKHRIIKNKKTILYDPKQPEIFVKERRESWMSKSLARQRATDAAIIAKVLADYRAAEERARLEQIREDAKTDELLADFDVSGFQWPPLWLRLLGEPGFHSNCDTEWAVQENYERRFCCIQRWSQNVTFLCRFGESLGFPREAKRWKKDQARRMKYDKRVKAAFVKSRSDENTE